MNNTSNTSPSPGRGFFRDLLSHISYPLSVVFDSRFGHLGEFIGGDGFTGWIRYSRYADNIDVGELQTLGNG